MKSKLCIYSSLLWPNEYMTFLWNILYAGWAKVTVNTATYYLQSGDRNPVRVRSCAPTQTGPGAHPASCATSMGFLSWEWSN